MRSLLKFITCGSVDDGKSTLIGHILYDSKLLYADQEKALELDSKVGSRGGAIDYSLLLDGLMAEREQGITIDVAYRYFTTDNRSFIVADTPGQDARCLLKIHNAHIHRDHPAPGRPGHPAHRGASGGQFPRHHGGHGAGGLGDALGHHTVIGTQDQYRPAVQFDIRTAGQSRDVLQRGLQQPKAAQRLGAGIPASPGRHPGPVIARSNLR